MENREFGKDISIIIYDNSPASFVQDKALTFGQYTAIYYRDTTNPGLAQAYNYGLNVAKDQQKEWLLLLDQDTSITKEYFDKVLQIQADKENTSQVLLPLIYEKERQLSPTYTDGRKVASGMYLQEDITAINSGCVISLEVFQKIPKFSLEFPLDYLDHWFFHQIQIQNISIQVMSVSLQHSLSVNNLNSVSDERLLNILRAEKKFFQEYRSNDLIRYKRHHFFRALKYCLTAPGKLKILWKVSREK